MSRFNYNRPNNGYESEPWRKHTTTNHVIDPIVVLEHQAQGHKVIITRCKPGSVHKGAYRCVDCNKHLAWQAKLPKYS